MQVKYEDEFKDGVVYLDGDETNNEEGNVINELNFHCMVSFVDYDLEWARVTGINRTVNRNTFSTRLQGLGFNIHKGTKGERQIKGLKLN